MKSVESSVLVDSDNHPSPVSSFGISVRGPPKQEVVADICYLPVCWSVPEIHPGFYTFQNTCTYVSLNWLLRGRVCVKHQT